MGRRTQRARRDAARAAVGYLGRLNAYLCEQCGGHTITIDIDAGTTPAMLGCRAKGVTAAGGRSCPGVARSLWYPQPWPPGVPDMPQWEWYRARGAQLQQLRNAGGEMWEHHRKGGLLLRPRQHSPS